ncbi:RraA family protein [Arsenicibacter rosenii]|uniref:Dimethylmenaquinone methyltransferase n=1 Tax=Arsenicibacter rosenii TaxID=1750698 RepID=A0A1S2VKF2_9BACT|nr:dimethylmenaquinone methyltransferase [Arsenicibacter rosenii]OIN59213.1 dimethylmenaquinone methyltransferase [Arsenicibacter rosenii]
MKKSTLLVSLLTLLTITARAQIQMTKEQILFYTAEWKGERMADGRPKVSDNLLKRLKNISLEEAWGIMRKDGYNNQFEGNWQIIRPEKPMVGRVLTAQYMPGRPDMDKPIKEKGKAEGRKGNTNSWPIDLLQENDVYVADGMGKIVWGTLIGDNLGNSIYAKSKTGVIFDGSVRDLEGLEEIEGFNGWVRGFDPSYIQDMTMTCINCPIRIGRAIAMPGDVVLAKKEGIIFIPAHLAEKVILESEFVSIQDAFGHQMLREGKYTPGQIDQQWTAEIKQDFMKWIDQNPARVPMPRADLDKLLKSKNW